MNWKLAVGSLILLSFASVVVWGIVTIDVLWQIFVTFVMVGTFALGIKWVAEGWIEWRSKKGRHE